MDQSSQKLEVAKNLYIQLKIDFLSKKLNILWQRIKHWMEKISGNGKVAEEILDKQDSAIIMKKLLIKRLEKMVEVDLKIIQENKRYWGAIDGYLNELPINLNLDKEIEKIKLELEQEK